MEFKHGGKERRNHRKPGGGFSDNAHHCRHRLVRSGAKIFSSIAANSMIIGFDPDARGQDLNFGKGFKKQLLAPKAVTSDENAFGFAFEILRQFKTVFRRQDY